jgi:hypothetical protein
MHTRCQAENEKQMQKYLAMKRVLKVSKKRKHRGDIFALYGVRVIWPDMLSAHCLNGPDVVVLRAVEPDVQPAVQPAAQQASQPTSTGSYLK